MQGIWPQYILFLSEPEITALKPGEGSQINPAMDCVPSQVMLCRSRVLPDSTPSSLGSLPTRVKQTLYLSNLYHLTQT